MINGTLSNRPLAPSLALLVPSALLVGLLVAGIVFLQQAYVPMTTVQLLIGMLGAFAAFALLFLPARFMLTLLFSATILCPILPTDVALSVAGMRCHPMEMLLLLLIGHGVILRWRRHPKMQVTPLHLCVLVYMAFFAYATGYGLWRGNDPLAILTDLRAPLFLGAFGIGALAMRRPDDLYYYGYLALSLVTLSAVATMTIFGYATVVGPIPDMPYGLSPWFRHAPGTGPGLQQLLGMEAGVILCVGMFWCPREPWFRRIIYVALGTLFFLTLALNFTWSTGLSIAVGLVFLAWLNLPPLGKGLVAGLALGAVALLGMGALVTGNVPPSLLHAPWMDAHVDEVALVLEAIRTQPFFGTGLGSTEADMTGMAPDSAMPMAQPLLRNSGLYFLWKGGLVGLAIVFLALGGLFLYSSRVVAALPTMSQRCFARCLQALFVGQLVASCIEPRLNTANGALFLVFWTMAFVLLEGSTKSATSTPAVLRLSAPELNRDDDESPFPPPKAPRPAPKVSPSLEQC